MLCVTREAINRSFSAADIACGRGGRVGDHNRRDNTRGTGGLGSTDSGEQRGDVRGTTHRAHFRVQRRSKPVRSDVLEHDRRYTERSRLRTRRRIGRSHRYRSRARRTGGRYHEHSHCVGNDDGHAIGSRTCEFGRCVGQREFLCHGESFGSGHLRCAGSGARHLDFDIHGDRRRDSDRDVDDHGDSRSEHGDGVG